MAVLGLLCALGAPASAQKFTITGYDTLTFRLNSVNGSSAGQQAFTYGNYERQRQIENNAGLNITGYLFPRVILNATINSSRYTPDRSRYNLEYRGNGLNIMAGDINVAMSGNEFAPFNKSLRGMKVEVGGREAECLLSQERAQVATDVFRARTAPDYSLRFSPIIDGRSGCESMASARSWGGPCHRLQHGDAVVPADDDHPATSTIEVSYNMPRMGAIQVSRRRPRRVLGERMGLTHHPDKRHGLRHGGGRLPHRPLHPTTPRWCSQPAIAPSSGS